MPSIIRIKRSAVSGNPATLAAGELAYSALPDNGANGGDRLYIGMGTETGGNAANHVVIGGKYFTDMLDHTPGVLTTSSAIVTDSNNKIGQLLVDNLDLNGNTITTTDSGNLILSAGGSAKISFYGAYTFPRTDGTAGYALVTDGSGNLSWAGVSTANTASNLAGGGAGQIPIQSASGVTTFIPAGSAGQLLQAGTNTATFVSTTTLYVGRAATADKWTTARTVTFTGDTTGTFTIDGSADVTSVNLTIQPNSVALGTDTTGIYVASADVSGFGLSGSANTEGSTFTVTSNATSTNANSTIVFRDGSGNFTAGTITAATAFSGTLGTGSAQSINTNALSLSNYADNTGILYFSNGAGLVASNSARFAWDNTAGVLRVKTNTTATSTATGALVVTGGVGIGGALFVGSTATITSTAASTTTVANNALQVTGGVGIDGSLYVNGPAVFKNDVVFSGTTTYVFSTNTVYTDNILNLHTPPGGVDGAWTVDDGKDVGLVFHNYKGADNDSFLGWANDSGYLEWYGSGLETVGGTFTNATYGIFKTGGIVLVNTTASSNTTTGALVVAGGVGIGGNTYIGGNLTVSGTINATISGSITTATNLAGGTAGQIPYQSAVGTTAFTGPGTAGQILVSGGTSGPTYTNTGSIYVYRATLADSATTATSAATAYALANTATTYVYRATLADTATTATSAATAYALANTATTYVYRATLADSATTATSAATAYALANTATTYVYRATLADSATTATSAATAYGLANTSTTYVGRAVLADTATTATSAATAYALANTATTYVYRATLADSATTANNLSGGAANQIAYQSGSGTTTFLPVGTYGQVLQVVNTATGAFAWGDIDGGTY